MKVELPYFSFDSIVIDVKFMRNNKTQSLFFNRQTKVTRKKRRPDDGESCTHLSIARVSTSGQRDREIISADFLAGATLGRFLQFQLRRDTQDQISPP
jgi:hypothetical protein